MNALPLLSFLNENFTSRYNPLLMDAILVRIFYAFIYRCYFGALILLTVPLHVHILRFV